MCHINLCKDIRIWVHSLINRFSLLSQIPHIEMIYAIRLSLYVYQATMWITSIIVLQLIIYMYYFMIKSWPYIKIVLSFLLYKHDCNYINCHESVCKCHFWDWRIALSNIIRWLDACLDTWCHWNFICLAIVKTLARGSTTSWEGSCIIRLYIDYNATTNT